MASLDQTRRMVRQPRVHLPKGVYHVMLRGHGGRDIFFGGDARREIDRLLGEGKARFEHRGNAYCRMSNHGHLAVEVGECRYPGVGRICRSGTRVGLIGAGTAWDICFKAATRHCWEEADPNRP